MKLKSIKIENMHNVIEKVYNFEDVTYLYGENGAGKSTVLEAIQLALLGYIPGTAKQTGAIFRHARGKFMSVTATIDDNGDDISICRTFSGTEKSAKSDVEITPEGISIESILSELELPIFNFDEFIGMSANKLKDWFIDFLPKQDKELNWDNIIHESIDGSVKCDTSDEVAELMYHINQFKEDGYTGVELVRQLNAWLKTQISFQKGNIDRLQSTIKSLIFYDDCEDVSEDSISDMENKMKEIQSLITQKSSYLALCKQYDAIREQVDSLSDVPNTVDESDEYQKAYKTVEINNEKINKLNSQYVDYNAEISQYITNIQARTSVIQSKGVCPFTKSKCQSVSEMVEQFEKECAEYEEKRTELMTKQNEVNGEISREITELKNEIQTCNKIMSQIEYSVQSKNRVSQQLASMTLPPYPTDLTIEELEDKMRTSVGTLSKMKANVQFNNLNEQLTQDKFKAELKLTLYKIWEKLTSAAGKLQTELSEGPFNEMETSMTTYLQKLFNTNEVEMKFYLSDKANSFSFGLKRNDRYIPFDLLSSGEKCLYMFAMMIYLTEVSQSPLKLIMIDDMLDHLDDSKALELFRSLPTLSNEVQMIVAGVKEVQDDNAKSIVIEVK